MKSWFAPIMLPVETTCSVIVFKKIWPQLILAYFFFFFFIFCGELNEDIWSAVWMYIILNVVICVILLDLYHNLWAKTFKILQIWRYNVFNALFNRAVHLRTPLEREFGWANLSEAAGITVSRAPCVLNMCSAVPILWSTWRILSIHSFNCR